MANNKVIMKKGSSASLPAIESGSLIFATDTGQTYLDISDTERIELRDTSKASVEELTTQITDAKQYAQLLDLKCFYTQSEPAETNKPCVLTLPAGADTSIELKKYVVENALFLINFRVGNSVSQFTLSIDNTSITVQDCPNLSAGENLLLIIYHDTDTSTIRGAILGILSSKMISSAGDGLTAENHIVSHLNYLTKGEEDSIYGGGAQVAETSQTIDLSSGSATFKIPKIKPGSLGHVSEIENYTVTLSKIDTTSTAAPGSIIPIYTVSDPYGVSMDATIFSPDGFTLDISSKTSQLIIINFESGNQASEHLEFIIDGKQFFTTNTVLFTSIPFSALFLIPHLNDTQIQFIGAFNIKTTYDEVILKYDINSETLTHSKQLTTGSTTTKYGGINFSTAGELTNSDTFSIPKIKVDEYGHVVSVEEDEAVLSVDTSGNGMGIKEFVYDAAHSSSTNFVYNSVISDITIKVNDLLLLNFEDDKTLHPDSSLITLTLNNMPTIVSTSCKVNKYSKFLFRVISISNPVGRIEPLGEILPGLSQGPDDLITLTTSANMTTLGHKESGIRGNAASTPGTTGEPVILNVINNTTYGTAPQLNFGDPIAINEITVDDCGHVTKETEWAANLPLPKRSDFGYETHAEFRNIVVVSSSTDVSTLDVPVGTIIFVKN